MNAPRKPSLSVIILMYNEEANIACVLDEHLAFLSETVGDFEILVVNDGSLDRGPEIVQSYAALDSRVRLVHHEVNCGMGAGMRTGIANAAKEVLVFQAADGQIAAASLGILLPLLERADIVLSTYSNRRETAAREWLSRGLRLYMRLLAGIDFRLQGLYLFPTLHARQLSSFIRADTFFFSFELIQRAIDRGLSVTVTQMEVRPRLSGSSKVASTRRVLRVARETLGFAIRRKLGR